MKRVLLVLLLCMAGLALFGLGDTVRGAGLYRIVFSMGVKVGEEKVCAINSDGTGFITLSGPEKTADEMPSCSPDGSRIAFVSFRTGNRDIFIMNADGSNVVQLTFTKEDEHYPSFSSDGRKIVYNRDIEDISQLFVMDLSTRVEKRITKDSFWNSRARWSPDGTRLAFESDRDGLSTQIYAMDPNGRKIMQLTKSGPTAGEWGFLDGSGSPCWSPDGSRIAFETLKDGFSFICIMNSDGTGQKTLVSSSGVLRSPAWSPDGGTIVFVSGRDQLCELYTIRLSGESPQRLTHLSSNITEPAWSLIPD